MHRIYCLTALALAIGGGAAAQVPPDIAAKLKADGSSLAVGKTIGYYAPLHARDAEAPVTVTRDLRYGPAERDLADVYVPQAPGHARSAVIFVHGGGFVAGQKSDAAQVGYWAANNGLVGVLISYPLAPQNPYPAGAKDLGLAVAWLKAHAKDYGVDPARIYVMGHSAGAVHVATYLSHRDLQPGGVPGVAGGILVSGFYDLPSFADSQNSYFGEDASLLAERSSQPGLVAGSVPLLVAYAELDLPGFEQQARGLEAKLTEAGRKDRLVVLADHNHISEIAAVNTSDKSLSGPVLAFINGRR